MIVTGRMEYNRHADYQIEEGPYVELEVIQDREARYYFCGGEMYVPFPVVENDPAYANVQADTKWRAKIDLPDPPRDGRVIRDLFFEEPVAAAYLARVKD